MQLLNHSRGWSSGPRRCASFHAELQHLRAARRDGAAPRRELGARLERHAVANLAQRWTALADHLLDRERGEVSLSRTSTTRSCFNARAQHLEDRKRKNSEGLLLAGVLREPDIGAGNVNPHLHREDRTSARATPRTDSATSSCVVSSKWAYSHPPRRLSSSGSQKLAGSTPPATPRHTRSAARQLAHLHDGAIDHVQRGGEEVVAEEQIHLLREPLRLRAAHRIRGHIAPGPRHEVRRPPTRAQALSLE